MLFRVAVFFLSFIVFSENLFAADAGLPAGAWESGDRSYDAAMQGCVYDDDRPMARIEVLQNSDEGRSLRSEFYSLGRGAGLRRNLLSSFADTARNVYVDLYRFGYKKDESIAHARKIATLRLELLCVYKVGRGWPEALGMATNEAQKIVSELLKAKRGW